jgi:hypothetical protein
MLTACILATDIVLLLYGLGVNQQEANFFNSLFIRNLHQYIQQLSENLCLGLHKFVALTAKVFTGQCSCDLGKK